MSVGSLCYDEPRAKARVMRRIEVGILTIGVMLVVSACSGKTTGATNVTDGSATLHASGACDKGQSCSWYWEYWPAGGSRSASVKTPVQGPVPGPANTSDLWTNIAGLTPNTTYRWVFCASPGNGGGYACAGPSGTFDDPSADPPSDSATFTTLPQQTLAEGYEFGASWAVQATPNPAGAISSVLAGVSCGGVSEVAEGTVKQVCTAVGSYQDSARAEHPLAEGWDQNWTIQALPGPTQGVLKGVDCSSQIPHKCTAVGQDLTTSDTLAERWNGTSWSIQTTPATGNSALLGVSCPTFDLCMAVGVQHGSSFSHNAALLAELWNGSSWTVRSTPSLSADDAFFAVSCASATACTAVGESSGAPLAESWNGSAWTTETVPTPAGGQSVTLSGVSCTAANACTAVGDYTNSSGTTVTLAERWNGNSWTIQSTPNPTGTQASDLNGVSCVLHGHAPEATTSCTAAGDYSQPTGTRSTLVESWNGTSWTLASTPDPAGAGYDAFYGVSCLAVLQACTAVGAG